MALIAAAPRVSQTFDQYRTKQQLIATYVVMLAITAALTAGDPVHGIGQRFQRHAQQLGKPTELADDLLGVARVYHGVVSTVDDQRRHEPRSARQAACRLVRRALG